LNLFIMNLLPIPALDGGKILLFLTEKIHPCFLRLHIPLSIAGWVLIMGLTLYTVVIDVLKYIA
jgi:regulator of sigma E protease